MKDDKLSRTVFNMHRNKIMEISDHYEGCEYEKRLVPIDECLCDCYTKQIFDLGREVERDLFYSS